MGRPGDDFELLLQAATPVEAQLAQGVLADAGIPVFVHSGDFDFAELGRAAHDRVRRPDVYVPRGTLERARSLLEQAWGAGAAELAADGGAALTPPERAVGSYRGWLLLLIVVLPLLIVLALAIRAAF